MRRDIQSANNIKSDHIYNLPGVLFWRIFLTVGYPKLTPPSPLSFLHPHDPSPLSLQDLSAPSVSFYIIFTSPTGGANKKRGGPAKNS